MISETHPGNTVPQDVAKAVLACLRDESKNIIAKHSGYGLMLAVLKPEVTIKEIKAQYRCNDCPNDFTYKGYTIMDMAYLRQCAGEDVWGEQSIAETLRVIWEHSNKRVTTLVRKETLRPHCGSPMVPQHGSNMQDLLRRAEERAVEIMAREIANRQMPPMPWQNTPMCYVDGRNGRLC